MIQHTTRRRRTIRTRVATRRPRPVARLRTTSGFRPLPRGLIIPLRCANDNDALELVKPGTCDGWDTGAALRCTTCRTEYVLFVALRRTPVTPVRERTTRRPS